VRSLGFIPARCDPSVSRLGVEGEGGISSDANKARSFGIRRHEGRRGDSARAYTVREPRREKYQARKVFIDSSCLSSATDGTRRAAAFQGFGRFFFFCSRPGSRSGSAAGDRIGRSVRRTWLGRPCSSGDVSRALGPPSAGRRRAGPQSRLPDQRSDSLRAPTMAGGRRRARGACPTGTTPIRI